MAAKGVKKTQSSNRAGSALNKEAASIAASLGIENRKRLVTIWPEFSDADINGEKWEVAHKGKEKDKGKSPVQQHYFDDPDGKIELPQCLRVDHWKRPPDFIRDKTPVVVDPEGYHGFDLLTPNEACFESELLRWIVGQIIALWKQSELKNPDGTPGIVHIDATNPALGEYHHSWRPWEHVYAINKTGKGYNMPALNPHGKYVVKLYWMGSWRKLIIDDSMPFDDQGRCLLPMTSLGNELWPMLLTKALIKVASLDYAGGNPSCEFGDFSVIHSLTSWLPEAIPLQQGHMLEIWKLLHGSLPEFKLPEPKPEVDAVEGDSTLGVIQEGVPGEKSEVSKDKSIMPEKSDVKAADKKDKKDDKKKDDKKEKGKDKEKEKTKDKILLQDHDQPLPEHPEVMVFASYSGPPKYPVRVSVLRDMADASETLRQKGLSHLYPHPVLIQQTRACPLEPPPPPEKIPAWKLIRPRKKKTTPSDEPVEEVKVIEKPIQSIQITSPFINYKVSPVPIPTDIHRPRSELERGQSRLCSRPGTANVDPIEETDENAPTPEPEPPQVLAVEEPAEEPKEELPKEGEKVTSGKGVKKKPSVSGKKSDESVSGKKSPAGRPKRETSASGKRADSSAKVDAKKSTEKVADSAKGSKQDSLAVPSSDEAGNTSGQEEELGEEEEAVKEDPHTHSEDMWIDFDEFCKCFKTLYIYHKWRTYPYNYQNSDLKHVQTGKDSKKTNPSTAVGGVTEDKSPYYLFVDSLKPTEISVSFSSLSRWPEPPAPPIKEEASKMDLKAGKGKEKDKESRVEAMTVESSSIIETVANTDSKAPEPVQPGLLVAEPYSWKSLVTGQSILRIRSSGIRSAVLNLPPGRHVLRFNMTAPLGYHYHLCSSTPFVFGDEEKVMAELTKESCRFVENANQVMQGLRKCIQGFNDPELIHSSWEEFFAAHCPYKDDKHISKTYHWKVFCEAHYSTMKKFLTEANLASLEMTYALRCMFMDSTTKNPLGVSSSAGSRPATGVPANERSSAKKGGKKREPSDAKLEQWKNREPTIDEHVGAVKIQKQFRGFRVRKIKAGRTPGTEDNLKAHELLQKAWNALEPNSEQIGLHLFRTMFKIDADMMPKYPFYKDEWNKISYADYQGSHPDQPPNTWFIVFREVFFVQEEMLCVPKLYVPLPTCKLRVINNDTGVEMPTVFQKVAPHVYTKNKKGYTFVAEARTTDQALQAGKWRMRLIGSLSSLPAPAKPDSVNATFHNRELKDYYLPNERNCILRYTVRAQEDHLVSLQLQTSKPDVYIKLQVLDNEEELLSTVGKGHVVLPSFIFQKDPEDPLNRTGSRASIKEKDSKDKSAKVTIKTRRASSAASRSSSVHRRSISSTEEEEEEAKPHKYIIQALVLRESWPLSEPQWIFVQQLKQLEKEELKVDFQAPVAQKERPPSPPKDQKKETKGKDKGKGKGGKDKDKDKAKDGSRPPSQQFDHSKPNWTLRIISDGPLAEELEVKKDTERADEIRAMKKAWEDAEPGRAAKALQSRLQYLNSHIIKVEGEGEEAPKVEGEQVPAQPSVPEPASSPTPQTLEADPDAPLSNIPPPPPPSKETLPPLDIQPYLRKSHNQPVFRDENEIQRQLEAKQKEIQMYRAYREDVEKRREADRIDRNISKVKQIQLCEQMQAALDAARDDINSPREAFRQKYLEAERKRLEEIAAQEAAMRAEMEKNTPTPKGGKKSAKGKKSASGKKKK